MEKFKQTVRLVKALDMTLLCCAQHRHQFILPEHFLAALCDNDQFCEAVGWFSDPRVLADKLTKFLNNLEQVPEGAKCTPWVSSQFSAVIKFANGQLEDVEKQRVDIPHMVMGIFKLQDSWANYLLRESVGDDPAEFMSKLISVLEGSETHAETNQREKQKADQWKAFVTCMNDQYHKHNPLIGREAELERTIQVLCRREKNNPLHVGESGVGKTALVWGLVRLIEEDHVPKRLTGSKVYQLDMGTLVAGTQYRGDFEKRIKLVMDGILQEGENNIVYFDEIHTLIGAGSTGGDALDASNMLKPYMESGRVRFIGSTTYGEYNRHMSQSQGLLRRFQQIDIAEPSIDEAKHILKQLKPLYEEFHGITYTDEAIDFAVEASAKHITGRFLPDKAVDLIDEAGAAMELSGDNNPVGKKEIAEVLSKICKVDSLSVAEDSDYERLYDLSDRMRSLIFGQDEAIRSVVEAVQLSRAGLLDDNKPLASLLFVGPTGVGKTEVAKVLAKELGIALVRFDMSEYTEKHAVSKLIGTPAGYVGYDDGGLLTDAIRKSPNCVLLLDEVEKAHSDIYNILLQVMDYASLTDNKGRKADFRNVILIMTSNAGAQFASKASVGFNSSVSRGENMMKQVKRTFKPEFLNRLSGTVVFHDMNQSMAARILDKKLGELREKLVKKQVELILTDQAHSYLLNEGFTAEYGAREMDRVIAQQLKPLLMREILFGSLKWGGMIKIGVADGGLSIG